MTDPDRAALSALVEQLDGLGCEMGDDGAWAQNNDSPLPGSAVLRYANELHRIQLELVGLLGRGDARRPGKEEEKNDEDPVSRIPGQ